MTKREELYNNELTYKADDNYAGRYDDDYDYDYYNYSYDEPDPNEWPDDFVNDVLDGFPDAYWNID